MTTPADTQASARAEADGPAAPPGSRSPLWATLTDAVLDGLIIAFGVWTLLYELAMARQSSARTAVLVWIPLTLLVVGLCVWRAARRRGVGPVAEPGDTAPPGGPPAGPARILGGVVAALGVAAAGAFYLWSGSHFLRGWGILVLASLALLAQVALAAAPRVGTWRPVAHPGAPLPGPRPWAYVAAAVVVLAVAVFSLFILETDGDDIYYVNRSLWAAEHDTFSLRDTMFGPETYRASYGGGVPIASIEGLLGALAPLLGVSTATITFLIAAPVACAFAGWAAWRLVVQWAPRRHLLVLVGSIMFAMMSSTGTVGDFAYTRMWTGKVMALTVVVPVALVYFTEFARAPRGSRSRWPVLMLLVCGLAFTGLTPTAVIMAPVISAAAVLGAVLTRTAVVRQIVGAIAFSAMPVLGGLAVLLLSERVGGGESARAPRPWGAFARTMGDDPVIIAIAMLALVVGPLLVRRGAAAALAASLSVAVVAVLTPGFSALMHAVTGSGPIYYRLLLVAPFAILVGMLLAAPLPRVLAPVARTAVVAVGSVALLSALALGGTTPWDESIGGRFMSSPTLKLPPEAVEDVEAVLALDPGPLVLLPTRVMGVMPIVTTESYPVVPRTFYLEGLAASEEEVRMRRALGAFSDPAVDPPPAPRVTEALDELGVDMVCLFPKARERVALVRAAGYGDPTRAGRLVCLRADE